MENNEHPSLAVINKQSEMVESDLTLDVDWLVKVVQADYQETEAPTAEWSGYMTATDWQNGLVSKATRYILMPLIDVTPANPDSCFTTLTLTVEFKMWHDHKYIHTVLAICNCLELHGLLTWQIY